MKKDDFDWALKRCKDRRDYFRLAYLNRKDLTPKQISICLEKQKLKHGKEYREFAVMMGTYLNRRHMQTCLNKQTQPYGFRDFLCRLGHLLTPDQKQLCLNKQETPSDYLAIVTECAKYLTTKQIDECLEKQETGDDYRKFIEVNSIYMLDKQLEKYREKDRGKFTYSDGEYRVEFIKED